MALANIFVNKIVIVELGNMIGILLALLCFANAIIRY